MPIGLLVQQCSIYRPSSQETKVYGRPTGQGVVLTLVSSNVRCRLDFAFLRGSREEAAAEEYVSRNRGLLNVDPSVDILERDIVVMDDAAYRSAQFEVEFVDAVVDGRGISHFEVTIAKRDNPYTFPDPPPDPP